MKTTEERFKQAYIEQFGFEYDPVDPETLTREARFKEDLGLDSLEEIELIMILEEEFNIEIPDELAEQCLTVGQAIDELDKLLITK